MWKKAQTAMTNLDLEEKILNSAIVGALVFLFFPWLSGQFLGIDNVSFSGIQFYVSYIGWTILTLHIVILLMTVLPIVGGPALVKRPWKAPVRLWLTAQTAFLTLASLSVLTRVTYEFRGLEIRYGVYFSLVCSLVATLYAFLQWHEERRNEVHEVFHHPEDVRQHVAPPQPETRSQVPPPPPPPPPLQPEDHNLRI